MSRQDQRLLLLVAGVGLLVGGHKLIDTELGELGIPHAVGVALVTAALRT